MKKDINSIIQTRAAAVNQGIKTASKIRSEDNGLQIQDIQERLKLQELISVISAKFVNLPPDQVDDSIESGLKIILEYMDIDRCTFGEFSQDRKTLLVTNSYFKPGFDAAVKGELAEIFPWLAGDLLRGEIIKIEKPDDLPPQAIEERDYCQRSGMKSILAIPISIGGSLLCTLGFLSFKNYRTWSNYLIQQLTLLGGVFSTAFFRKRVEEENRKHFKTLTAQYEFEKLISGLSARFINLRTMEVGQQIVESLRQLSEYLDVDRSIFFRISKDKNQLIPLYIYTAEGMETVKDIPFKSWIPWVAAKILSGKVVVFSSEDKLTLEAENDRVQLEEKLGTKSLIGVPLQFEGKVEYVLSISNVVRRHKMQEAIAPRLQLVGEIFMNALVRSKSMEQMKKKDTQLKSAYNKISRISEQLARENRYYRDEIDSTFNSNQVIGISGGLKYIFYRIKQVAVNNTTVLIEGETGTGKELIARALHEFSHLKDKPLIKIDCTTLHDTIIESELFGYVKGAYTGANSEHMGRIELADNATLFLDEVGEIPLALQAKLLRIIEYGEFERLGSSKTSKVNLRIIAATNRNLNEEVKQGRFRQDLYYRLNVFPLSVPPLRDRKEDIPLLANFFVQRLNRQIGKNVRKISANVLKSLQEYTWPGNVRELENVIERAMIISDGSVLQLMNLPIQQNPLPLTANSYASLQEMEREYILTVLKETYWRIEGKTGAALKLGLHPDTLRSRMKKLGIQRPTASP